MQIIFNQEKNQRVVTFLNREKVDFLDKLGKDALFSTGVKLSRAKLIAWLVDFIEQLNVNGKGIKDEEDFEDKLRDALENNFKKTVPPATETNREARYEK